MSLKPGYSYDTVQANIAQMIDEGYPENQAVAASKENARKCYWKRYPQGFLPPHLKYPDGSRHRPKKNPADCGCRKSNPVPPLPHGSGYWVIVNKETGEAVVELFDKRNVERINAEKYKAVPSGEYLASLNKRRTNPVPPSSRARSRGRYDSKQHRINSAAKLYEDFTGHEAKQALTIDIPELPDVMLCVGDIDFVGYTTVRDGKVEKYIHKFKKECRPLFAVSHDGKQLYMIGGSYDFTERGIVDRTK